MHLPGRQEDQLDHGSKPCRPLHEEGFLSPVGTDPAAFAAFSRAREVKTPVKDLQNRNTWQVAYELIDRAPELDISQKYCMVNEHPIGKSGEQVLFPALAIPVETKQNYECPEEHFSVLCEQLRKVDKLLLIGWRATEDHFLKLLRDNLPSGIRGMVVAGNKDEANKTIKNIAGAGIKGDFLPTNGGFSDFVVRREGEVLLKS